MRKIKFNILESEEILHRGISTSSVVSEAFNSSEALVMLKNTLAYSAEYLIKHRNFKAAQYLLTHVPDTLMQKIADVAKVTGTNTGFCVGMGKMGTSMLSQSVPVEIIHSMEQHGFEFEGGQFDLADLFFSAFITG